MLFFKIIMYFVVFLVIECSTVSNSEISYALSDKFINEINSKQSLWTAGRNFNRRTPSSYIRSLAGTIIDDSVQLPVKNYNYKTIIIPQNFSTFDKWSYCKSIKEIRDQGSCSSCWAVSVASVMTDRTCIFLKKKFHVSAQDLLSCCKSCWGSGTGCDGGKMPNAYLFYNKTGVVSGGNYNSYKGCRPYELPPCDHNIVSKHNPCIKSNYTPVCKTKCNRFYNREYYSDKIRSTEVYNAKNDVEEIKYEIYKNGPVSATFLLHTDFLTYKSGIYKHEDGGLIGYHSVKLIGWGVKKNITYWLAANSWNRSWGNKGFFKFLSGSNHCEIEQHVSFGYP